MTKNNILMLFVLICCSLFFVFGYKISTLQAQYKNIPANNISYVQINNLKILDVSPIDKEGKGFIISAVKDVGWKCIKFLSAESLSSSSCNLNLRKLIIRKGVSIKVNENTKLLLRNRQKADISFFNRNDKINVYGSLILKDGIIEALIIRNLSKQSFPTPTSSSVIPTPDLNFVEGYLKKQESSIYMWGSYILTSKDNKSYLVKGENPKIDDLLSDLAKRNILVRLYGDIKYQNLEGGFWSIVVKKAEEVRSENNLDKNNQCFVGGCSGQICSNDPYVVSTCEWRPEYACYKNAKCEIQKDGNCGWTITPEIEECLQKIQNVY
jgi:hypothetical protein